MTTPTDKPVLSFTVHVNEETDPPTALCTPHQVSVSTGNALIEFELLTPGYSFDPDTPITFNTATTDFPDLWFISATQVTMRDRCQTPGDFAFTIHVVEDSSGTPFSVDPTVRNQPT